MQPLQTIQQGSTGQAVIQWQEFLLQHGYVIVGTADGIFGKNTNTATIAFQTTAGLTADGVVGSHTYAAAMALGFNSPALPQTASYLGIDLYHGDGAINWGEVKTDPQNIQFAYLKATEGTGFVDPAFAPNRAAAAAVAMPTGAYHFYHPELSPIDQANFFCRIIASLQPSDLPPALDFEPVNLMGVTLAQAISDLNTFLHTVQTILGKKPVIYTNYNSWVNVLENPTSFNSYPLWIASYNATPPNLFGGWTEWAIWQYTDGGAVNGVPNNTVDMNRYNTNSGLIQST